MNRRRLRRHLVGVTCGHRFNKSLLLFANVKGTICSQFPVCLLGNTVILEKQTIKSNYNSRCYFQFANNNEGFSRPLIVVALMTCRWLATCPSILLPRAIMGCTSHYIGIAPGSAWLLVPTVEMWSLKRGRRARTARDG